MASAKHEEGNMWPEDQLNDSEAEAHGIEQSWECVLYLIDEDKLLAVVRFRVI